MAVDGSGAAAAAAAAWDTAAAIAHYCFDCHTTGLRSANFAIS